MNEWLEIASKNIKHLKTSRGWTQEVLADRAGVSKSVVRDLEAGNERATSSLDTISKIAKALEVELGDILSENVRPKKDHFNHEPVSIFIKKLIMIPDDIYELASQVSDDDQYDCWESVRGVLEHYAEKNAPIKEDAFKKEA